VEITKSASDVYSPIAMQLGGGVRELSTGDWMSMAPLRDWLRSNGLKSLDNIYSSPKAPAHLVAKALGWTHYNLPV
jgi:hypothetical protein